MVPLVRSESDSVIQGSTMNRAFFPLILAVLVGCESAHEPLPPPPDTTTREVDYSTWASVTEEPYGYPSLEEER